MKEQLSESQKSLAKAAVSLIHNATILLGQIDDEIQSLGSTGENPVNHTEYSLKCTCEYITNWIDDGIDI